MVTTHVHNTSELAVSEQLKPLELMKRSVGVGLITVRLFQVIDS